MPGKTHTTKEITCCGQRWRMRSPADLETLWETMGEEDFDRDERLPYWVEIWPAAVVLGEWICSHASEIRAKACLDVGSGLGLSACIAASCGAHVVAMDYEWQAMYFSRINMELNKVRFAPVQMDWRSPGFTKGAFAFLFGADILYERRFAEPVADFFRSVMGPETRAVLTEPRRSVSKEVWEIIASAGFSLRRVESKKISWKDYEVEIVLRELQRIT